MGSSKDTYSEESEVKFGIDYSKLFFTSDIHFGHTNVIKYCDRPFSTARDMDRQIIENYNSVVPKDGVCIWVGDCFFLPKSISKRIMKQLNGKKILIMGNHDKKMLYMMQLGFDFACYQMRLNMGGKGVVVCHYPWKSDYQSEFKYYDRCPVPQHKDDWLIHGHVHEKWRQKGNMINVGIDVWDYKPVNWQTLENMVAKNEKRVLNRFGDEIKIKEIK